ncbi:MAG: arginine deiminase-related protein [Saprospiraceae bacterium]|nr:arginine deiminase-related protein [Saprospiraceae bacterium]
MVSKQCTDTVLMVRPIAFGFNVDTASSNVFQQKLSDLEPKEIQNLAQLEFDYFVDLLQLHYIQTIVVEDTLVPHTPDSIFPNNWLQTNSNKQLYTFPMEGNNRRLERREDLLKSLQDQYSYQVDRSLVSFEQQSRYLEGTGSLVLDRVHKIAYAALSSRTDPKALEAYAQLTGYKICSFETVPFEGQAIYHTNVVMSIGENYVLIGSELIATKDKKRVLATLAESNRKVILLSSTQVCEYFAANALEVKNRKGEGYLLLSEKAKSSLTVQQLSLIQEDLQLKILAPAIHIIETIGGGSVRCMLAEIFY